MRLKPPVLVVLVVPGLLAGSASAQQAAEGDSGGVLFYTHCAACHGREGEGDGPVAEQLEFVPPDLTRITRRAGGRFPTEELHRIVDGRKPVKGHGGPEMPIWGDAFRAERDGFDEAAAQARIRRIVEYIETLQEENQ
jgi:mono/diheme cytochrome c family protein